MKTMLQVLAMVMVLVFMAGCGTLGMPAMVKALAKDPATVTGKITSVYGVATFVRVGEVKPGMTVSASPDGTVTVSNPAPAVTVPAVANDTVSVPVKLTITAPEAVKAGK